MVLGYNSSDLLLDFDGRCMAKHEDNAVVFLLCLLVGILLVVLVFVLLRLMTVDASLRHNKREVDKAIILLRDAREKLKKEQGDE